MAYEILIENLQRLAVGMGISLNTVLIQSGAGKNFVSNINKGSDPSTDKVTKLADYFGVSTDYLLGRTDEKKGPPATVSSDEGPRDPLEEQLMSHVRKLTPDQQEFLLAQIKMLQERQ